MHPAIQTYLDELKQQFYTGHAREHSYRPALKSLMMTFERMNAINEPKQSEHGAPDFIFLSSDNNDLILGYAEAKDIDANLDRVEMSEQLTRYGGYENLFLTNYLEFRFYTNGEKYETISLGEVKNGVLHLDSSQGERLIHELQAFLELPPETIKNGKRLATIMGGKARRIRDNVAYYLEHDEQNAGELNKIYEMMKKLLVHDLDHAKFADMYAQTLVYGLFVARYGDSTDHDFSRSEARDLVPASNPFLRHFFDHIAGTGFDRRLAKIVDELCEIFSVSNVQEIVHKHLRIQDETSDAKDPIIHFYEDFLQQYDPAERKKMGAYYTPTPVVKYIVRQVDRILREDFGISKGLASTETVQYQVETGQDLRADRRTKRETHQTLTVPRVQVLDPAVGTATFLNETIKFIHKEFEGQEGRWPSYVNDNLLKRLHGFELMMAPYTIAHLKLGMTLKETGVDKLNERLGVYLTNTLEEGIPQQPDLFSFGLAEAVSEESRLASEVKSERPVMVVMGNPPYSGVSSNETKFANALIEKYKVEPGGKQKLQERKHWLNDDYVKFIAFAEDMVEKNGEGIVAMITNNGYLDNPTFRGMRWHLAKTFDKIYVLDLHGNAKKREVAPDGGKDENVFDIMQGVGIVLAVKTGKKSDNEPAKVYHADSYGTRQVKFDELDKNIEFTEISPDQKSVYFVPKNTESEAEYMQGVALDMLFPQNVTGIVTMGDNFIVSESRDVIVGRVQKLAHGEYTEERLNSQFGLGKNYAKFVLEAGSGLRFDESKLAKLSYRPFDVRWTYFDNKVLWRWRGKLMMNYFHENIGLIAKRGDIEQKAGAVFISDAISDFRYWSRPGMQGGDYTYPLYLYHEDGSRTPNFAPAELSALTRQLTSEPSPEDILDYIYAVLHSPSYRAKYKEFLKIDFPRVPVPTQADFDRLVPLGRELRQLHLMKSPSIDDYATTYPAAGDDTVDKISYSDGKVYINATQYFGNIPELAWNFYIGGYQPAQKWLKDRKGRKLSSEDLDHYQKIIKILLETDRIMKEIG